MKKDTSEHAKSLKYWADRGGQIEWRLAKLKGDVAEMERDLKECDEMIEKLKQSCPEGQSSTKEKP